MMSVQVNPCPAFLSGMCDYRDDTDESFGYKPTKVAATEEILTQLKGNLPGLFDINFGSRPGSQNKATLTLIRIQLAN